MASEEGRQAGQQFLGSCSAANLSAAMGLANLIMSWSAVVAPCCEEHLLHLLPSTITICCRLQCREEFRKENAASLRQAILSLKRWCVHHYSFISIALTACPLPIDALCLQDGD
jgi:hypothetical protein